MTLITSYASHIPEELNAVKAISDRIDQLAEALTASYPDFDFSQLQKTNKNRFVAKIGSRRIARMRASKNALTPPLDHEAPLIKRGFLFQQTTDLVDAAEQAFALDLPDVALPMLAQSVSSLLRMVAEAERDSPVKEKKSGKQDKNLG